MVAAALYRSKTVTKVFGIGREIAALVLKIIRLKGNRTGVEVGIVQQRATAIDEHRVGLVGMALHQPSGHIRSHLHTVQDTLHAQRGLVQNLCGTINSLLSNGLASLIEQESQGDIEDDGSKEYYPQADSDGEFATDICDDSFHNCQLSIVN